MEGILAPWHWIIIIAVVMLVFGPKKLPELGSSLGKGITGFRKGLKDVQDEVSDAVSAGESDTAEKPLAELKQPVVAQSPAEAVEEKTPLA